MSVDELYAKAQQVAEEHLAACLEAFDAESMGEDVEWPDIRAPFDGCLTCQVRETLHAAMPILREIAVTEHHERGS